jgi:hypothetical protein
MSQNSEYLSSPGSRRAGLKKGQRHKGQFKAGHDPRRYVPAVNPRKKEFQELCKEQGEKAVETLVEALGDTGAGWKDRLLAAEMLISHGFGKAVDRIQVANMAVGQGSLKDADMDVLMGVLERRTSALIGSDMGQDIDEPHEIQGDHLEHNGLENRQEDDHDQ